MPTELVEPIGIVGFGLEGEAVLRMLLSEGVKQIVVVDGANRAQAVRAIAPDAMVHTGPHYLEGLRSVRTIIRSPGINPQDLKPYLHDRIVTTPTNLFFERCGAQIIGITGTKGKGTTATLIYHLLRAHLTGKNVHLVGNIGLPALELLPSIQRDDIVIMELSSFQLVDLNYSPHIAVVLDITADHLDWHGSRTQYRDAKRAIVAHQTAQDYAVINADYLHALQFALLTSGSVRWFSRRHIVDRGVSVDHQTFTLHEYEQSKPIIPATSLHLKGVHNLENVAAALVVADLFKVEVPLMRSIVKGFQGLEHRLEHVRDWHGISFVNDTLATNPAATIAAVESIKAPVVLLLGGSHKGASFTDLALTLKKHPLHGVIVFGLTADAMRQALVEAGITSPIVSGGTTMQQIIHTALGYAQPGDTVLLSPAAASFGLFTDAKDRGRQFKDIVNALAD